MVRMELLVGGFRGKFNIENIMRLALYFRHSRKSTLSPMTVSLDMSDGRFEAVFSSDIDSPLWVRNKPVTYYRRKITSDHYHFSAKHG